MSESKRETRDSVFKLVFGEPVLLSQFLRDYSPLDVLRDVEPEHIRDLSERFVSTISGNLDSDTVKEIAIPEWGELYIIAMTEHESNVKQRMPMKLFHYMSRIWEAYEERSEKERQGSTGLVEFKYPPILPIVYYDGPDRWTAPTRLLQKVWGGDQLARFIPNFEYHLVSLRELSEREIIEKKNALATALLVDKAKSPSDVIRYAEEYAEFLQEVDASTSERVQMILLECLAALLRRINVPEERVVEFVEQVHEGGSQICLECYNPMIGRKRGAPHLRKVKKKCSKSFSSMAILR